MSIFDTARMTNDQCRDEARKLAEVHPFGGSEKVKSLLSLMSKEGRRTYDTVTRTERTNAARLIEDVIMQFAATSANEAEAILETLKDAPVTDAAKQDIHLQAASQTALTLKLSIVVAWRTAEALRMMTMRDKAEFLARVDSVHSQLKHIIEDTARRIDLPKPAGKVFSFTADQFAERMSAADDVFQKLAAEGRLPGCGDPECPDCKGADANITPPSEGDFDKMVDAAMAEKRRSRLN